MKLILLFTLSVSLTTLAGPDIDPRVILFNNAEKHITTDADRLILGPGRLQKHFTLHCTEKFNRIFSQQSEIRHYHENKSCIAKTHKLVPDFDADKVLYSRYDCLWRIDNCLDIKNTTSPHEVLYEKGQMFFLSDKDSVDIEESYTLSAQEQKKLVAKIKTIPSLEKVNFIYARPAENWATRKIELEKTWPIDKHRDIFLHVLKVQPDKNTQSTHSSGDLDVLIIVLESGSNLYFLKHSYIEYIPDYPVVYNDHDASHVQTDFYVLDKKSSVGLIKINGSFYRLLDDGTVESIPYAYQWD
ncbi:hypothetical protein [Pseudobdellovibrio exovorus]|uniref:Organic solvent tolerance-like N-terminal domain-containing protein n=1 Tax=Pseudobdellovibrio exovorus JSS TaxID=1184267 RepID=M4VSL9_9BACT|nr:hypothetical protein [Pseudobdellovibrio exovorus]AGH96209.1 hypothetical protein A11Q_1993 [Pseudobdellovibrio exovorus JSS]